MEQQKKVNTWGCLVLFVLFIVVVFAISYTPEGPPLTPEEQAQKNISDQFGFDGMHFRLANLVESSLNDPDSFEHVSTIHEVKEDYILVKMTYRARNGFNALILKSVTAKVNKDNGFVLEIIKEE